MIDSRKYRIPPWSSVVNIVILVAIICMTYSINETVSNRFTVLRNVYRVSVTNLISQTIDYPSEHGYDYHLINAIVSEVNLIPDAFVQLYDSDYEPIIDTDIQEKYNFYPIKYKNTIDRSTGPDNYIPTVINGSSWKVYYRWVTHMGAFPGRTLVVYGCSDNYFDYSEVTFTDNMILILVFLIIVKDYAVENTTIEKIFKVIINRNGHVN